MIIWTTLLVFSLVQIIIYLMLFVILREFPLHKKDYDEEKENDITTEVDRLEIPLYFVMGKYDYMTSTNTAKAYYDNLDAPIKEFVVFEHSAHYPQFEEETFFADWLIKTWKSLEF